jgi:hypothetical protein
MGLNVELSEMQRKPAAVKKLLLQMRLPAPERTRNRLDLRMGFLND